jgi:hypothetical protein
MAARRHASEQEGGITALISFHKGLVSRRSILIDAAVSVCAPAIVRIANLMPVRNLPLPFGPQYAGYCERLLFQALDGDLRSGQMNTHLNGKLVSETEAQRIVSYARTHGFLPS